jgi:tetratricopeptide (TPR) repeat protein
MEQQRKRTAMSSVWGTSLGIVTAVTVSALSVAGCGKVAELQAQRSFKTANQAYAAQDYVKAAALYEEAIRDNPELGVAYFFLGNSYDQQFKPSRKGEPDNDALLEKAVQNYTIASEKLSTTTDETLKPYAKRSLEYLVAAYSGDKLNDPAKAEPIIQRMIQLEPTEPTNYFNLANLYEQAGAYAEAEKALMDAKQVRPNDPQVYLQLAGFYNRQGPEQFAKTMEALEQRAQIEPNNPEAFQTIAAYYWDETRLDSRLTDAQKREYVDKGMQAIEKALSIRPDYVEAITFKGLLLRLQANLEKDPAKQQALIKEATQLSDKANELRKRQATGVSQ